MQRLTNLLVFILLFAIIFSPSIAILNGNDAQSLGIDVRYEGDLVFSTVNMQISAEENDLHVSSLIDFESRGLTPALSFTITSHGARLANLLDPESVKDIIARRETWGSTSKLMATVAYTLFAKLNGIN